MEDEITKRIMEYINKASYNYAVLIDGIWGCGKTYYVNKILIPHIQKAEAESKEKDMNHIKRKVIYVSLYGITSKNEILQKILIEILPLSKIIKSKGFKATSNICKAIISVFLSLKGINIPKNLLDYNDYLSLKNCILIFDDLERCEMLINETLGFINQFIEHDGIKCLIVANEKEISTIDKGRNRELKYLVALNSNIDYKEKENIDKKLSSTFSTNRDSNEVNKIEPHYLTKLSNVIFSEDEIYNQIKEKLIGFTINYKPNITNVIETILRNNYVDIKEVIRANEEFIIARCNYNNHYNIRTLLFSFDKFQTINKSIEKFKTYIQANESIDIVTNDIFKYTFYIALQNKMGLPFEKWLDNNEISEDYIEGLINPTNLIKKFKFVDEYIYTDIMHEEKVFGVIERYDNITHKQLLYKKDSLYKLSNDWQTINDSEAYELISKVNADIKNSPEKYDITDYPKILFLNILLSKLKVININPDNVLADMLSNLQVCDTLYTVDMFGWYSITFEDKEADALYNDKIKVLNKEIMKVSKAKLATNLTNIISNYSDWPKKLFNFVDDNRSSFFENQAFLSMIDNENLLVAIKQLDNTDLFNFRKVLKLIYSSENINEFFSSDKEIVESLKCKLDEYETGIRETHKIRSHVIKLLINDLSEINGKLKTNYSKT